MSRQNKVNPGMYTQRGRLTPDDAARELRKQSAVRSQIRNRGANRPQVGARPTQATTTPEDRPITKARPTTTANRTKRKPTGNTVAAGGTRGRAAGSRPASARRKR